MSTNPATIKVWDIAVRIFHWSLVISFFAAYFIEDDIELHVIFGYIVFGLVCFRILWGLVGSKYARFTDFLYSPSIIKGYAKNLLKGMSVRYIGHNPLGGVMIIALLLSLFGTSFSGMKLYAIADGEGPLAVFETSDYDDDDFEEMEDFWEDVHEFFADLTMLLIGLHVVGVVYASFAHRENLVKSMLTGIKDKHPPQ